MHIFEACLACLETHQHKAQDCKFVALLFAGKHFGTVVEDVARTPYFVGDTVKVTFQSACPRNNVRTGDTFLQVQKLQEETGHWITGSSNVMIIAL